MTDRLKDSPGAGPIAGHFTLDSTEDVSWPAVTFGPTWNGFATPVVTRQTLREMLARSPEGHRWEHDTVFVWSTIDLEDGASPDPSAVDRISPRPDGTYDLGVLGWAFELVRV